MRLLGLSYRQVKAGSLKRKELEECGRGWKLLKTAAHKDAVEYSQILDDFWHSELASEPDNQNKDTVRVFRGPDSSGVQMYELHSRRAEKASGKKLLTIFRNSEFAKRLNEGRPRDKQVRLGRKQLSAYKCACVKKRKASQCDCEPCTYVADNLQTVHRQRMGWHAAAKKQRGGAPCDCHIHGAAARAGLKLEQARAAAEAAWHAAGVACQHGPRVGRRRQRRDRRRKSVNYMFTTLIRDEIANQRYMQFHY